MTSFWREMPDGIELRARVMPGASADRLEGKRTMADGSVWLAAKVRAVPEKGKANQALAKLLARAFDIPQSCVSVIAGASGRQKTVAMAGDPTVLIEKAKRIAAHHR